MVDAAVFPRARIERLPGSIGRRRRLRLPGALDVRPARHACRPVSGRHDPAAAMFQGVAPGVGRRAGNKELWPLDVFEI
jgi:hypothetical protein